MNKKFTTPLVALAVTASLGVNAQTQSPASCQDGYTFPTTSEVIISEQRCTASKETGTDFRNTYIEIYNGTGATVALDNYVFLYSNNGGGFGAREGDTLMLTGVTLEHGATFVVKRTSTDPATLPDADWNVQWDALTANGDDGIALGITADNHATYTILDILGTEARAYHDVAGVSEATKDHTLQRKETVSDPSDDFSTTVGTDASDSEWIVTANDSYDYGNLNLPTGCVIVSSINTIEEVGFYVYQNKEGVVNIDTEKSMIVGVHDMNGNLVRQLNVSKTAQVSGLKAGMYVFTNEKGQSVKIVVQ